MASISGKKVDVAFDGGRLTGDAGALLLREVEARCGILKRIVSSIDDKRHPGYVDHSAASLVEQRVFRIACVLMHTLARIGLRGTKWARFDTIRNRLLKIAGRVKRV